jgi:hypothetical protein
MKRARPLLAAIAILALAIAPVAAAETEEVEEVEEVEEIEEIEEIELTEERVYFHCNGDTKVANVHAVADETIVGWSTTAPTASFTEGAGCGTADTGLTGAADHNPLYDAPFAGTFRGHIDSLTVHAHSLLPVTANLLDEFHVNVLLQINGRTIIDRETVVTAEAIESETGLSSLFEFTVTDIGLIDEERPTRLYSVQLTLMTHYLDDNNNWVFDATEVDSGITFNPTEQAAVALPAQ